MSEDTSVKSIAIAMLDQLGALRKLVANQTETLVGINSMLDTHTKALRMHQAVIERVADELGIGGQSGQARGRIRASLSSNRTILELRQTPQPASQKFGKCKEQASGKCLKQLLAEMLGNFRDETAEDGRPARSRAGPWIRNWRDLPKKASYIGTLSGSQPSRRRSSFASQTLDHLAS